MAENEPRFVLALSYETRLFTSSFDRLSEHLKKNPAKLAKLEQWLDNPKRRDIKVSIEAADFIGDLLLVIDNGALPTRNNAVRDHMVNLLRAAASKARSDLSG